MAQVVGQWLHSKKSTITVFPKGVVGENRYGDNILGELPGIEIKGVILSRAITSAFSRREMEDHDEGHQPFTRWKILVPGNDPWPGGLHTQIEWKGERFDQYGEATLNETGIRTAHTVVYMQSRSAEVK
jgi:hypothetical protein